MSICGPLRGGKPAYDDLTGSSFALPSPRSGRSQSLMREPREETCLSLSVWLPLYGCVCMLSHHSQCQPCAARLQQASAPCPFCRSPVQGVLFLKPVEESFSSKLAFMRATSYRCTADRIPSEVLHEASGEAASSPSCYTP